MIARLKISILTVIVGLSMSGLSPLAAEDFDDRAAFKEDRDESLYYQRPTRRPDTREIIFQKAQARAYQRQARLASMNWYGMSSSRPTAAPTPFTSMYSPVWQMPGGRPFAWHPGDWPRYVVYTR